MKCALPGMYGKPIPHPKYHTRTSKPLIELQKEEILNNIYEVDTDESINNILSEWEDRLKSFDIDCSEKYNFNIMRGGATERKPSNRFDEYVKRLLEKDSQEHSQD